MQPNLRTASTSNPIIRDSQPGPTNQVGTLVNGTTVQLTDSTSQPLMVQDGQVPSNVTDPDVPAAHPLDSQNLRTSTTGQGPPTNGTGATGATGPVDATGANEGTGAVADTGQAERTTTARALHRETADALGFLLGDLKSYLKHPEKVHVPLADVGTGRFEPTNGAHTDAAKAMLRQLIHEHSRPFGIPDGVAKAATQVLKALNIALDNLEGTGVYTFRSSTPAPAVPDRPAPPEDDRDGPETAQDEPVTLSGAVQNFRRELDTEPVDIRNARRGTTSDDQPKLRRQDNSRDLLGLAPGLQVGGQEQESVGDVLKREIAALKDAVATQPQEEGRPKLERRNARADLQLPAQAPTPDDGSASTAEELGRDSGSFQDRLAATIDKGPPVLSSAPSGPAVKEGETDSTKADDRSGSAAVGKTPLEKARELGSKVIDLPPLPKHKDD